MIEKEKNMLKNIEAVIFDVDGTLVDSMWVWQSVDHDYFERYHLTPPESFYDDIEGMSYSEVARYYLDTFPQITCTMEELMDEWTQMAHHKYLHEVPLKKGVRTFIEHMRGAGMKIGISTSNRKEMVQDMLKEFGMDPLFDAIHSACEAGAGKPAPDVYLMTAEALGVAPEKCLVFEDVPNGILAGKNAGMKVCAVEDDFSSAQEEKKRKLADYYIQDYDEIEQGTYEVL